MYPLLNNIPEKLPLHFDALEISKKCFATTENNLKKGEFILYGAGQNGALLANKLNTIGIKALAFADDTLTKQGNNFFDLDVMSLDDAYDRFGSEVLIVVTIFTPSVDFLTIKQKILDRGFTNVVSLLYVFYAYPSLFLPYYHFDEPENILVNVNELSAAYTLFDEQLSKKVFLSNLYFRLQLDYDVLSKRDNDYYFPQDIYPQQDYNKLVYIDCGAYDGDSIEKVIRKGFDIEHIYGFEPDPVNFERANVNVQQLGEAVAKKTTLKKLGISNTATTRKFNSSGAMGSCLDDEGNLIIETITIDSFIDRHIPDINTNIFLKMDIEGEEMKALEGAENTIRNYTPSLAISMYHTVKDLWAIPLYIHSLNQGYQFFLRQHGADSMDLVLYAKAARHII